MECTRAVIPAWGALPLLRLVASALLLGGCQGPFLLCLLRVRFLSAPCSLGISSMCPHTRVPRGEDSCLSAVYVLCHTEPARREQLLME